jgi:hypothetical protein
MNSSKYINNEGQLLKYLEGKLSGDELYEFQKMMAESNLLNDAVEGLEIVGNTNKINTYVADLNKHLQNYTSSKRDRRIKNHLQLNDWSLISIFLTIALCIFGYIVVKLLKS